MKKLTVRTKASMFILICLLSSVFCSLSYAEVPHLLNYQGRLTDSEGTPLNGTYELTFRIYDAETAGSFLWEEVHAGVVIEKGIFSILLGSVVDLDLAFDAPYFLEIKVDSEVMSPRQAITSSAYAIRAETVESADKIKADSDDPAFGYLSEKIDNVTIKLDTSTHKLYIPHGSQIFTSSGIFTAPAGVVRVYVTMCGGGGGGGSGNAVLGGGGGGAGATYVKYPYTVAPGNSYEVIIGSGGLGGIGSGSDGSAGDATRFDASGGNLTALGGNGGGGDGTGGIGSGGLDSGAYLSVGSCTIKGGNGGTATMSGGAGGASFIGKGATGRCYSDPGNGSSAASNTGGGGGGSAGNHHNGGAGGSGICIIEW